MSPAEASLIGRTLGRYRLERELGSGGMGVVYAAHDTHLDRRVAIKVLRREAISDTGRRLRFVREARSASLLNHPNIITVHDIGVEGDIDFIAMEYVDGEPLGDRIGRGLPMAEALEYARQIASGLTAAHEAGIVHRDLKPANIMVTRNRQVKLLDFGLAKLTERQSGETTVPTRTGGLATEAGVILGTAAYMSPEQAAGAPADARSDIFAFGSVLYEMVTGRRAFSAPTNVETLSRVLREDPQPASELARDVPPDLARVIERCLRKDPDRRSQHMADVKLALDEIPTPATRPGSVVKGAKRRFAWRVAGAATAVALVAVLGFRFFSPAPAGIGRIAVLPLDNISGDAGQDYFADGMTEALIDRLGRIGALRVTSRTSVMRYKSRKPPPREIAAGLGVDALVDGSAMRVGDQVRVTAQLIDARRDELLWSDSYDRPFTDALVVQSEIAQAIAHAISVAVTPEETTRLEGTPGVNPQAYENYLRGRHEFNLGPARANRAMEYFQRALELDPGYAPAYAAMADIWGFRGNWGFIPWSEGRALFIQRATRALELDPSLGAAHYLAAKIALYANWEWSRAEQEFRRAIELNPSDIAARFDYGLFLSDMERLDEAAAQFRLARELDPFNALYIGADGLTGVVRGQYQAAIRNLRAAVAQDPGLVPWHMFLWSVLANVGEFRQALEEARTFHGLLGNEEAATALADATDGETGYRAAMGRAAAAMEARSARVYVSPMWIAQLYVSAGDTERALTWLEHALEERNPLLPFLRRTPFWSGLRDEPRFQAIVRRMNFPT